MGSSALCYQPVEHRPLAGGFREHYSHCNGSPPTFYHSSSAFNSNGASPQLPPPPPPQYGTPYYYPYVSMPNISPSSHQHELCHPSAQQKPPAGIAPSYYPQANPRAQCDVSTYRNEHHLHKNDRAALETPSKRKCEEHAASDSIKKSKWNEIIYEGPAPHYPP